MGQGIVDKVDSEKFDLEGIEHAADVPGGGLPAVTEFPTYGMEMTPDELKLVSPVYCYLMSFVRGKELIRRCSTRRSIGRWISVFCLSWLRCTS